MLFRSASQSEGKAKGRSQGEGKASRQGESQGQASRSEERTGREASRPGCGSGPAGACGECTRATDGDQPGGRVAVSYRFQALGGAMGQGPSCWTHDEPVPLGEAPIPGLVPGIGAQYRYGLLLCIKALGQAAGRRLDFFLNY